MSHGTPTRTANSPQFGDMAAWGYNVTAGGFLLWLFVCADGTQFTSMEARRPDTTYEGKTWYGRGVARVPLSLLSVSRAQRLALPRMHRWVRQWDNSRGLETWTFDTENDAQIFAEVHMQV